MALLVVRGESERQKRAPEGMRGLYGRCLGQPCKGGQSLMQSKQASGLPRMVSTPPTPTQDTSPRAPAKDHELAEEQRLLQRVGQPRHAHAGGAAAQAAQVAEQALEAKDVEGGDRVCRGEGRGGEG